MLTPPTRHPQTWAQAVDDIREQYDLTTEEIANWLGVSDNAVCPSSPGHEPSWPSVWEIIQPLLT